MESKKGGGKMKIFIKKVKWLNVLKCLGFIGCLALVIHDFYMITIYSWVHSISVGFTWFGLGTFVMAIMIADLIYQDFEEQLIAIEKKERA